MSRIVVLDTETTGLSWERGNRVVEIGCVELVERRLSGRTFQRYINPGREMEVGAQEVTGLNLDFLSDKPKFEEVIDEFLDFVRDSTLVIHNASFDIGFLNYELSLAGKHFGAMRDHTVDVIDSLKLARERFPGQRNSLDALCRRLGVDNAHRTVHGALLDAELLTDVYIALTSGQTSLALDSAKKSDSATVLDVNQSLAGISFIQRAPDQTDIAEHEKRLNDLNKKAGTNWSW